MRLVKFSFPLLLGLMALLNANAQVQGEELIAKPDTIKREISTIEVAEQTTTTQSDSTEIQRDLPQAEIEAKSAEKDSLKAEIIPAPEVEIAVASPDTDKVKNEGVEEAEETIKAEPDTIAPETAIIEAELIAEKLDTMPLEPIVLSPELASEYIGNLIGRKDLWRKTDDSLKLSLRRLIDHYSEPFDSVNYRLLQFPFDSIKFNPAELVQNDTLPIKWLSKSMFIIDTVALEKEPFIIQRTIVKQVIDPSTLQLFDVMPDIKEKIESYLQAKDTIVEKVLDYKYIESKKLQLYEYSDKRITPSILPRGSTRPARFIADSTKLVIPKIKKGLLAQEDSPFLFIPSERMTDSLRVAVKTLSSFTNKRDSIELNINDLVGRSTPLWLTSGSDDLHRYWVKNSKNDSITIWIGNPSKYDLVLILEEDVSVERFEKRLVDDIPFTSAKPDRSLAKLSPLKEIPVFWDYGLVSSYSLNQNYLSNWARGGESSLASMLDINAKANYTNKEAKTRWSNSGRVRYATTRTKEQGFRTNTDIIEINSQYNKVMREKIDFSTVLYFKTQVAKG